MRRAGKPDVPTLVAGLALVALGAVLLLDSLHAFELRLETLAPIACAAVGAVLLASGLAHRD
ncbi:MAG: hypothetical protein QOJ07_3134 [Thermoleophilaceae bacterium]|nr:hypothetical protein [Thermoleophilaceae bacterium]